MKKLLFGALLVLSACAANPGPSIPVKPGHDLAFARRAVQGCSANAEAGGTSAVVGGYATGVILVGVVLGPAIVGMNQDTIYENGKIDGVDRCLAKHGFERRDLTDGEVFWLGDSYGTERENRLSHLIGGGTVESYKPTLN